MNFSPLILAALLGIYILISRAIMRHAEGKWRESAMGILNLAAFYFFLIYHPQGENLSKLLIFAFIILTQYLMLRMFCELPGRCFWLAFFAPIGFLVAVRYLPNEFYASLAKLSGSRVLRRPVLVGISYMAFRCSRLALEVRNGMAKKPGFWEYITFAFFLPTMPVGPINTYANFRRGFESPLWEVPVGRAVLRILVGLVKYDFLSGVLGKLTYSEFLLNGHLHHWIDLPICMACYFVYLYCNFSGFCDMAIGAAALIGIPVPENFDNPFTARNTKDFWNRWHITLSQWMRDIVFAPLSKFLVRVMGPPNVNHAVAIAIFVVFLLVGIWHGVGWNYAVFGALQAVGVVANHYYTIGLKSWLGREGFRAYMGNRWIHAVAVAATFCYYAATLMFFANTLPQVREIFSILRWS